MGVKGNRGGDARGLWKLVVEKAKNDLPAPAMRPPLAVLTLQPAQRYCAIEDIHFSGTWRAEPENYRGRGFVYLFRGEMAKWEALAWAKEKNRKNGFA